MDHRLAAWAREVKARQRRRDLPVLWLFTDAVRLVDPCAAIAALPPRLCGVVFRHDGVAGRAALARRVARLCRALGIALVVAGDARIASAVGAGVHLRGGHRSGFERRGFGKRGYGQRSWLRAGALVTSSAHSAAEVRRAMAMGVDAVFLSPVLPTPSHPGAPALGVVRWAAGARQARGAVMALGGVEGGMIRRLPRWCGGAGAIGALMH